MKKIIIGAAVVIAAGFLIFSCDLFGIVPDVQPASLENAEYTDLPSNEEEAMALFASAAGNTSMSVMEGLGDELDAAMNDIETRALLSRLITPLLPPEQIAPKTVSATGYTDDYEAKISLSIKNETISGSDTGGSGTATIDSFVIKGNGKTNAAFDEGDGDASINGAIEFDKYMPYSGAAEITDGKIDILGDMSASFTESGSSLAVSYNIHLSVKAGLSISGDTGGKIIFSFTYNDKNDITVDYTATDPSAVVSSLEQNLDISATLKVYNNENDLINEYSWTEDDLFELFEEEFDSLYF